MYSAIAEASLKDLEIKDNAMVHTENSYKENNVLRLPLKEVIEWIKTISLGNYKEFQSLVELTKKIVRKRYSFGEGL